MQKIRTQCAQIAIMITALCGIVVNAEEFKIETTAEDIPKKALIVKHQAKLFNSSSGDSAKEAPFIQLYFLMTPEKNNRVPVLKSFNRRRTQPDGWLEKESFVEWNTIQMIDFTPQAGRLRVKIFSNKRCARKFARAGKTVGNCQELGEEPERNSEQEQQRRFLVPLFQRGRITYRGGFVRVYQGEENVTPLSPGYDLVLVVDSTLSMRRYLPSTLEALEIFVRHVQSSMINKTAIPLRIGLLFFRDRQGINCELEYVTHWAQPLTEEVDKVIEALNQAKVTHCNSHNVNEAVWDGINRAIVDTEWNKDHFNTIILIGDAPPYPESHPQGNPMQFSVTSINEIAAEKNIRFLNFKIGKRDEKEFQELALATEAHRKGAFNSISKGKISEFQKRLINALTREWDSVMKLQQILENTHNMASNQLDLSDYEYPIITYQLQRMEHDVSKDFVKGWVPQTIQGAPAFGEYLFIRKNDLKIRINILDNIVTAAEDGMIDGSDAFLDAIRRTLAAQLKMRFDEVFSGGETLDQILNKTKILPFKTQILSFTPEEINTWKASDYQNIMEYLIKKLNSLRAFIAEPNNQHYFGKKMAYLYVPRSYFP